MAYDEENMKNQFLPSWDVWRKYVEQGFEMVNDEFGEVFNEIYSMKMYTHQIKLTMPDLGHTIYLKIMTPSATAYNAENVDTAIADCGSADSPIPCTGIWRNTNVDTFKQVLSIYKGSEQTLSRYTITYFDASTGVVEATPFLPVVSDLVLPKS